MVTKGMGGITEMPHKYLAPSDQMVALNRPHLLQATTQLAKSDTRPPAPTRARIISLPGSPMSRCPRIPAGLKPTASVSTTPAPNAR